MSAKSVDAKIGDDSHAKALGIATRLDRMMIGLRAPQDHPCRWNSKSAILYLARRMHIQAELTGPVVVDEATVAWLEAAYARQPENIDITTRLRRKALGRPYEHAMLLIEAAEEIERLRDEQ